MKNVPLLSSQILLVLTGVAIDFKLLLLFFNVSSCSFLFLANTTSCFYILGYGIV